MVVYTITSLLNMWFILNLYNYLSYYVDLLLEVKKKEHLEAFQSDKKLNTNNYVYISIY